MPTINDITNAASYRGDANLGGGGGFVLDIDLKPVQQLAQYTYLYNKSQYDQRQKDADEKIKTLAGLTAYDAATGEGKDKDEVLKRVSALREKGANFASKKWKNPDEKTKAYFEFQRSIAEDIKAINSATARQLKMTAYKDKVQADNTLTVPEKELRIKQAEKAFNDTDIYTLPTFTQFDLTTPSVGEPLTEKINIIKKDAAGNAVILQTVDEYSITGNNKLAYLEGNNLLFPAPPAPGASQQQKDEFEQKKLAFAKTKIGGWQDAEQFYAGALTDPNYKKTVTSSGINVVGQPATTTLTDEIDIDKIKASNSLLGGINNLGEAYNKYIAQKIKNLENGYYEDAVGNKILFEGGSDKVEDLKASFIDLSKPLSPQSLASLARFEKARPDKVEKKFIETDDAIQKRNIDLDYKVAWKNAETARMNALDKGDKKSPDVIDKPAILFGQHIDRLKTIFAKDPTPIVVQFNAVDDKTRIAAKLSEGDEITYKPDGSYEVSGSDKKIKSIGTIENLAQGFIDAVKVVDLSGGVDKDGTMAEGFQIKSENKFKEIFGNISGKVIWDNWGTKPTETKTESTGNTININDVPAGTKLTQKKGKYYYNGKEVIQ